MTDPATSIPPRESLGESDAFLARRSAPPSTADAVLAGLVWVAALAGLAVYVAAPYLPAISPLGSR